MNKRKFADESGRPPAKRRRLAISEESLDDFGRFLVVDGPQTGSATLQATATIMLTFAAGVRHKATYLSHLDSLLRKVASVLVGVPGLRMLGSREAYKDASKGDHYHLVITSSAVRDWSADVARLFVLVNPRWDARAAREGALFRQVHVLILPRNFYKCLAYPSKTRKKKGPADSRLAWWPADNLDWVDTINLSLLQYGRGDAFPQNLLEEQLALRAENAARALSGQPLVVTMGHDWQYPENKLDYPALYDGGV